MTDFPCEAATQHSCFLCGIDLSRKCSHNFNKGGKSAILADLFMTNVFIKKAKQARPVEPRLMQVKLDWSSRFQRSRFLENFKALAGLEENLDQTVS